MSEEQFSVDLDKLDTGPTIEKRVRIWTSWIESGLDVPPIKVLEKTDAPGFWRVYSGAEAVVAARRLGLRALPCSLR